MKTLKIPEWLYEELVGFKNQYCLSKNLTSNIKAVTKYRKLAGSKTITKKELGELYKWLKKTDYTPEIPIGFMVQAFFESFVELGIAKKYRCDKSEKFLHNALSFYEHIGCKSTKNYMKLKKLIAKSIL